MKSPSPWTFNSSKRNATGSLARLRISQEKRPAPVNSAQSVRAELQERLDFVGKADDALAVRGKLSADRGGIVRSRSIHTVVSSRHTVLSPERRLHQAPRADLDKLFAKTPSTKSRGRSHPARTFSRIRRSPGRNITGESHGLSQVSAADGARTQDSLLLREVMASVPCGALGDAAPDASIAKRRMGGALRSQYAGEAKKIVSAALGERLPDYSVINVEEAMIYTWHQ